MNVSLREMTEEEIAEWLPLIRVGYADDMVRNGGADPNAARARAERETEQLFPDGIPSDDQFVFVIEAEGEPVGELWLAEREGDFRRELWIFIVRISEEHRGQGYARAAMEWAETEAKRRGLTHVALNVFGGNEAARRLYQSLGYVEDAVSMSKAV